MARSCIFGTARFAISFRNLLEKSSRRAIGNRYAHQNRTIIIELETPLKGENLPKIRMNILGYFSLFLTRVARMRTLPICKSSYGEERVRFLPETHTLRLYR